MRDKFVGAILGTFVGDALGMPVENWPHEKIARRLGTLDTMRDAAVWLQMYGVAFGVAYDPKGGLGKVRLKRGTYTDDTQMTLCVTESLVACEGFDGADMARRFAEDFDPRRGYGPGAMKALRALQRGALWDQVGTQLFGGTGSYGNGAAMRAAPIGLFYADDPDELRRVAELAASITHAHPLGREGAALQAYAVACALRREPGRDFDPHAFLAGLRAFVLPDREAFVRKLTLLEDLLARSPSVPEVVRVLGNEVTAPNSVPAALYAFLAHPHSFKEAVVYAVNLGGDTDTIGAMTGAVAGAFHGAAAIPTDWLEALENGPKGRDYARQLGERLYDRSVPPFRD